MRSSTQQLEKAEQDKHDLQRKLKAAQEGGAAAAQKVCFPFPFVSYEMSIQGLPVTVLIAHYFNLPWRPSVWLC